MSVSQLFKVRAVIIPYSVMNATNGSYVSSEKIETFPFVYWPNDRPCDAVNMYIMDIAHTLTGDSLVAVASVLTHLIRYCWKKDIGFAELKDLDMFDLSEILQSEKSRSDANRFQRNHNTVRRILSYIITFLFWYQSKFVSALASPLIGLADSLPKIIVERRKTIGPTKRWREFYYTHRSMPPAGSVEGKHPIALPVIEGIESAIDRLTSLEAQSKGFTRRYMNQPDFMLSQLAYLRSRRHFLIWIMKRTGLRPSEMVKIDLSQHFDILQLKRILIPTSKRRRTTVPVRSFPITLKDATVFHRYITARMKYAAVLQRNGLKLADSNSLFLGAKGEAIKKSSLEREFARLVRAAGFYDIQACLSMFRHRFITYEVIVHLKEFIVGSGKSRQMMTDSDYQSILKRVSAKTGHGSVESLWHYIDLAWEEIDVWGGVDKAINRLHAADRLHDELLELIRELDVKKAPLAAKVVVQEVSAKLRTILDSAKEDIT